MRWQQSTLNTQVSLALNNKGGDPKGESLQPEMHLIAYILPWREFTGSDNINSARGAMS